MRHRLGLSPLLRCRALVELRVACDDDVPALTALIERSARALSEGFYSESEREAAIADVFGVDTALIADGTYYVATDNGSLCGCGGWSKRRTLYGGDHRKRDADTPLDPHVDAARIRAFFVAPEHARKGVGSALLQTCAAAAFDAGFRRLELVATLPGVPLYSAFGFVAREEIVETARSGVNIRFVRMERALLQRELRATVGRSDVASSTLRSR